MSDPTLTEFLLARIDEDEAEATSLLRSDAVNDSDSELSWGWERDYGPTGYLSITPARVLAECEAKRRLLADLATFSRIRDQAAEGTTPLPQALTTAGIVTGLEHAAKLLTLPYADHPDYRQEWKP